jgi:gliding motility-associated-like protein
MFVFGMLNIAQGQVNLIPDPGFEDTIQCPTYAPCGDIFLTHWFNPNIDTCLTSPDYYHTCYLNNMSLCPTLTELCNPYEGNAFIHIFLYLNNGNGENMREFISTKLVSPLIKNKKYCISFYAKSSQSAYYFTSNLGIYFSEQKPVSYIPWPSEFVLNEPSTENKDSNFVNFNWKKIELEYIALGGEKYITIGNFQEDINTILLYSNLTNPNPNFKAATIYLDFVSVYECEEDSIPTEPPPASDSSLHYKVPNVISPNSDGLNDAFVLESRGIKEVSVKLYNRWGEEVVSHKVSGISADVLSKTTLWDATHKGQPAPQGVYYYLIELSTKNGEVIIEKGTVTVL